METKKKIEQMIEGLDEVKLQQVAEYISFLKFRSRFGNKSVQNDNEWSRLYAEFADTDRLEAEEGMEAYNRILAEEDTRFSWTDGR